MSRQIVPMPAENDRHFIIRSQDDQEIGYRPPSRSPSPEIPPGFKPEAPKESGQFPGCHNLVSLLERLAGAKASDAIIVPARSWDRNNKHWEYKVSLLKKKHREELQDKELQLKQRYDEKYSDAKYRQLVLEKEVRAMEFAKNESHGVLGRTFQDHQKNKEALEQKYVHKVEELEAKLAESEKNAKTQAKMLEKKDEELVKKDIELAKKGEDLDKQKEINKAIQNTVKMMGGGGNMHHPNELSQQLEPPRQYPEPQRYSQIHLQQQSPAQQPSAQQNYPLHPDQQPPIQRNYPENCLPQQPPIQHDYPQIHPHHQPPVQQPHIQQLLIQQDCPQNHLPQQSPVQRNYSKNHLPQQPPIQQDYTPHHDQNSPVQQNYPRNHLPQQPPIENPAASDSRFPLRVPRVPTGQFIANPPLLENQQSLQENHTAFTDPRANWAAPNDVHPHMHPNGGVEGNQQSSSRHSASHQGPSPGQSPAHDNGGIGRVNGRIDPQTKPNPILSTGAQHTSPGRSINRGGSHSNSPIAAAVKKREHSPELDYPGHPAHQVAVLPVEGDGNGLVVHNVPSNVAVGSEENAKKFRRGKRRKSEAKAPSGGITTSPNGARGPLIVSEAAMSIMVSSERPRRIDLAVQADYSCHSHKYILNKIHGGRLHSLVVKSETRVIITFVDSDAALSFYNLYNNGPPCYKRHHLNVTWAEIQGPNIDHNTAQEILSGATRYIRITIFRNSPASEDTLMSPLRFEPNAVWKHNVSKTATQTTVSIEYVDISNAIKATKIFKSGRLPNYEDADVEYILDPYEHRAPGPTTFPAAWGVGEPNPPPPRETQ